MAVVRIKRRCNEEPLDILLLTCKKRKTDVEESHKTSLFKIAATVNEQDDKSLHFAHQFKKEAEQKIKKENVKFKKVVDKLRKEHKVNSENNRLKVVNCYRALDEAKLLSTDDGNENKNPEPGGLTVLDVETFQETQEKSSETSAAVPEGSYVYDIYYTADGSDLSDVQIDHELSVYPMDSDLSSYLCADIDNSDSEAPDDEDDSNDENNWRNDYPDEEDFSSDEDGREISGMKLCSNFNSLKIGSDDEDDADEYLDYPDDYDDSPREMSSDEDLYSGNLSPSDVCNFGESYAKYKAKVKSEYDSSCSVKSDDESQE